MFVCVCVCVYRRGSLHFIPSVAKIYPFRIPVGHSVHQKCFTTPAKSIFLLKKREPYGPRRQYSSVCTDKGGREDREFERHWIMQGERVDGVTGRAGHRGKRALSCPLQPLKDNKPQPPRRVDINSLHLYMCTPSKPHPKCNNSPLTHESPFTLRKLMITWKILHCCIFLYFHASMTAVDVNYWSRIAVFCSLLLTAHVGGMFWSKHKQKAT